MSKLGHKLVMGLIALGVTVSLAACGSGSTNNTSGGGASATSAASSPGYKLALAAVTAAEKPMQLQLPSTPVDMAKNKGKTVMYVAPDMEIPFIASIASGVQAAAKAAGMNAVVCDGKGNVNTFNQCVAEAVSQKVNGIILQGINPALVSAPLKQAEAANIPVIDSLNGDPNQPLTNGLSAHVTVNYTEGGKLLADYVTVASKGHGQLVVFTSSIYTVYQNMLAGFKSELAKACPGCKLDAVENVQPTQVSTELGTITSTMLSRFPNAKYFVPFYDGMVTFMTPSIQQVSSHVQIISHDGVTTNIDLIRAGQVQTADVSNPPNASMGWAEVDEIGRLMAGQPAVFENLPQQIFVKANVGANDSNLFPGYAGYQTKYEKLWGVSK